MMTIAATFIHTDLKSINMQDPESTIPQTAIVALQELRSLEYQFDDVSHRMGTHGERGLYRQRKSLMSQVRKAKDKFNAEFGPKHTAVRTGNYPFWFIRTNEEI